MKKILFASLIIFISIFYYVFYNENKPELRIIGIVNYSHAAVPAILGLKEGLKELGYIEGINIRFLEKGVQKSSKSIHKTASEFIDQGAELIFAVTTIATKAAIKASHATKTPVVFAPARDPVKEEIVNSLKRPGGNATGVTFIFQEDRRLEWLFDLLPQTQKILVPYFNSEWNHKNKLHMLDKQAAMKNREFIFLKISDSEDISEQIDRALDSSFDALYIPADTYLVTRQQKIIKAALAKKVPSSSPILRGVNHGALYSFGFNRFQIGKQGAGLVDRILKGAKPADLPVEIGEFRLKINTTTAKLLGLKIDDVYLKQAKLVY